MTPDDLFWRQEIGNWDHCAFSLLPSRRMVLVLRNVRSKEFPNAFAVYLGHEGYFIPYDNGRSDHYDSNLRIAKWGGLSMDIGPLEAMCLVEVLIENRGRLSTELPPEVT